MTEFHFKTTDGHGDVVIEVAETAEHALIKIQNFYKKWHFELVAQFCLDCE
jgi:hypothetical protein